jgi:hypothetical protein
MLSNALTHLSASCQAKLPVLALRTQATAITFLDNRTDANRSAYSFSPAYASYSTWTIGMVTANGSSQAGAYTLPQTLQGGLRKPDGRAVVVLVDFWKMGGAEQSLTLVHELLHVYFNSGSHTAVANFLGVKLSGGASDSAASKAIDDWMRRGCVN